jgi:hypothetical protein
MMLKIIGVLTVALFGRFWVIFDLIFGSFLLPTEDGWQ